MTATGRQDLLGRRVVVTGAASGIGRACLELSRECGATVLAIDRDEAALEELAAGGRVLYEPCDLTRVELLPALVDRCADRLGGVDGLVNAAGVFQTRRLLDIEPDDFDFVFAVNLRSLFFLMRGVASLMAERGGGSIVNFSSAAARVPRPLSSHYAASKAAVESFTKSAAAALGGDGVRVNAVCPGTIETPMIENVRRSRAAALGKTMQELDAEWRAASPMGRLGTPGEVAEVTAFLLSDAAGFVNGESIGVTGGSDYD